MADLANLNVLMLLHGDLPHDQRVQRSIRGLIEAGCNVKIITFHTGSEQLTLAYPSCEIHSITPHFTKGPQLFAESIARIAWEVNTQNSYDIVHAHDLDMALAALIGRSDPEIPVIYDSHEWWTQSSGVGRRKWVEKIWSLAERWLVHQPNVSIITVNEAISELFQHNYNLPQQPTIIRNISEHSSDNHEQHVVNKQFSDRLRQWKNSGKFIIAYSGALCNGRSLKLLLQMVNQDSNICALIMGDGPLEPILKNYVKTKNISHRCLFTGMMPYAEMMNLLFLAHCGWCLIEPISTSYRLALPNKLFDYLEASLPVVASKLPVMHHLLRDNPNMFWVSNPSQIHSTLQSLKLLKEDKSSNEQFIAEDKLLNWDIEKNKLIELYQSCYSANS